MTPPTKFYRVTQITFCFKFSNLGLALGMALIFYSNAAKGLILKVRKFWGLIPPFVEVTGEKLVGKAFLVPYPE